MTEPKDRRGRLAETIRLVITRRERAARSPAMERALKRLIWRYNHMLQDQDVDDSNQDMEGFDS
jgi:hypothetical protein